MRPDTFFQLFAAHALENERILSCIYVLLPNTRQETYGAFYRELRRVVQGRPDDTDFELASMNSVAMNLQNVDIKGCLYHLSNNI